MKLLGENGRGMWEKRTKSTATLSLSRPPAPPQTLKNVMAANPILIPILPTWRY